MRTKKIEELVYDDLMERSAGILLHPTSLPGPFGIGDLGPSARRFAEWAAEAGFSWWQLLPLGPPGPGFSPYSARSSFALSPWLISPEDLVETGLLTKATLKAGFAWPPQAFDPMGMEEQKGLALRQAHLCWKNDAGAGEQGSLEAFREEEKSWLEDWALFASIKRAEGGAGWLDWPEGLRLRNREEMESARSRLADDVEFEVLCQYLAFKQWDRLTVEADRRGLRFFGDLPIFVALDSADVWSRRQFFKLDESGRPRVVAGVPPDYFSLTGQLWGNPLYDWEAMKRDDYGWWIRRLEHALKLTPLLRIDHFRGFAAHWEIPAEAQTAETGRWVAGPGRALFDAFRRAGGLRDAEELPFIAEDLGVITEDVVQLREELDLPGMAILQFGFSTESRSSFIPYAHRRRQVVYTGTHDNNTIQGWFDEEAAEEQKRLFLDYGGCEETDVSWCMIRMALASVAGLAVIPFQDFLGLGADARMNIPGQADANWSFRLSEDMLSADLRARIRHLVEVYGR